MIFLFINWCVQAKVDQDQFFFYVFVEINQGSEQPGEPGKVRGFHISGKA